MAEYLDFLKKYHKPIKFTASGTVNAGELVLVGSIYALAFQNYVDGEEAVGVQWSDGAFVPKDPGVGSAFGIGDILWLNPAAPTAVYNADGGSYVKVGFATEVAADADTHVLAYFDGYVR